MTHGLWEEGWHTPAHCYQHPPLKHTAVPAIPYRHIPAIKKKENFTATTHVGLLFWAITHVLFWVIFEHISQEIIFQSFKI